MIGKQSFTFRRRKKESVKGSPYFIYFFRRERERETRNAKRKQLKTQLSGFSFGYGLDPIYFQN